MTGLNVLKRAVPGGAAEKAGGWHAGDVLVGGDDVIPGWDLCVRSLAVGEAATFARWCEYVDERAAARVLVRRAPATQGPARARSVAAWPCLLYTSDAADE